MVALVDTGRAISLWEELGAVIHLGKAVRGLSLERVIRLSAWLGLGSVGVEPEGRMVTGAQGPTAVAVLVGSSA